MITKRLHFYFIIFQSFNLDLNFMLSLLLFFENDENLLTNFRRHKKVVTVPNFCREIQIWYQIFYMPANQ